MVGGRCRERKVNRPHRSLSSFTRFTRVFLSLAAQPGGLRPLHGPFPLSLCVTEGPCSAPTGLPPAARSEGVMREAKRPVTARIKKQFILEPLKIIPLGQVLSLSGPYGPWDDDWPTGRATDEGNGQNLTTKELFVICCLPSLPWSFYTSSLFVCSLQSHPRSRGERRLHYINILNPRL